LTAGVTATAGPFSGTAPSGGPTAVGSTGADKSTSAGVSPSDFSLYTGGSGESFSVMIQNSIGSYAGNSGPLFFFGGDGSSYGSVEVEYDYNAVPIPEAQTLWAGLAALSICGVALHRRFRRNRSCS
jgi:hypothetical protein